MTWKFGGFRTTCSPIIPFLELCPAYYETSRTAFFLELKLSRRPQGQKTDLGAREACKALRLKAPSGIESWVRLASWHGTKTERLQLCPPFLSWICIDLYSDWWCVKEQDWLGIWWWCVSGVCVQHGKSRWLVIEQVFLFLFWNINDTWNEYGVLCVRSIQALKELRSARSGCAGLWAIIHWQMSKKPVSEARFSWTFLEIAEGRSQHQDYAKFSIPFENIFTHERQ